MARTSGPLTRARIVASAAARMARIWWMVVSIPPRRMLVVDDERVEIEVGEHLGGLGAAHEEPGAAARPARAQSGEEPAHACANAWCRSAMRSSTSSMPVE